MFSRRVAVRRHRRARAPARRRARRLRGDHRARRCSGCATALYSMRMSPDRRRPLVAKRLLAAQWTIDESTAVSTAQPTLRGQRVGFWVTGAVIYVGWNLTTLLGRAARQPGRRRPSVRTGRRRRGRVPRPALAATARPAADRRRDRGGGGGRRAHPVAAARRPGARRGRRRRGRRPDELARGGERHDVWNIVLLGSVIRARAQARRLPGATVAPRAPHAGAGREPAHRRAARGARRHSDHRRSAAPSCSTRACRRCSSPRVLFALRVPFIVVVIAAAATAALLRLLGWMA